MTIRADAAQISQVLINVMNNSAEAMPTGGTIDVESYCFSADSGTSTARITISDSGDGIDDEVISHMFEPFWTTKPQGTGLGLAVSYRIIEAHGGTMSVESRSAGGCRFTITLPA